MNLIKYYEQEKEFSMIPHDYPRPYMYRKSWRSLNGWWEFDFYDDNFLLSPEEKIAGPLLQKIHVPYSYQTAMSGIGTENIHEQVIYRRKIELTAEERAGRVILHFGAVDFKTDVWIDNTAAGSHEGGYSPFYFDITSFVGEKSEITIALIVEDTSSREQPRGKQAAGTPFACWYKAVTGIWQSVWIEFLPEENITDFSLVQNSHSGTFHYRLNVSSPGGHDFIEADVQLKGKSIVTQRRECHYPVTEMDLTVPQPHTWSPEEPTLYTVHLSLVRNGDTIDSIETYASFRDLDIKPDGLYLNAKRYFQKLILMQGYWKESGYTAPEATSFDTDITYAKEMGFNGCRMHMKFEDPRFLYAADRLGFMVWEEAPAFYSFSEKSCSLFRKELTDIIMRDRWHPSLIVWVIGNESWGMQDIKNSRTIQSWLQEIFDLIRRLDPTRPIISNDGWEHLNSDIMTLHSYEHTPESLEEDWKRARRNERCGIHNKGFSLMPISRLDLPWILSEFGAVSFVAQSDHSEHWGYGEAAEDGKVLLDTIADLIENASSLDGISGWCYTQFSDIEQEKNGLLFEDRTPKVEISRIRALLESII